MLTRVCLGKYQLNYKLLDWPFAKVMNLRIALRPSWSSKTVWQKPSLNRSCGTIGFAGIRSMLDTPEFSWNPQVVRIWGDFVGSVCGRLLVCFSMPSGSTDQRGVPEIQGVGLNSTRIIQIKYPSHRCSWLLSNLEVQYIRGFFNPPGGRWYRLGRCDVRWWNRCKGAESRDLLDEGKSATKDAEAQELVIPIQHSWENCSIASVIIFQCETICSMVAQNSMCLFIVTYLTINL